MKQTISRRRFLETGGALAAGLLSHQSQAATNPLPALHSSSGTRASMPTRNLGKTGHKVSLFSLGGQSAIEKPPKKELRVPSISSSPMKQ